MTVTSDDKYCFSFEICENGVMMMRAEAGQREGELIESGKRINPDKTRLGVREFGAGSE